MLMDSIEKTVNGFFASIPRKKPKATHVDQARLIAHRGAHNKKLKIIENTREAFQLAQDLGFWGIEFDVHATADGVLVVNHDPTLNRLWGHDIAIAQLSFGDLRALEPKIPSLTEVITEYGQKMHLFIELKTPFTAEKALQLSLQGLSPMTDYHLLSLDSHTFKTLSLFPKPALLLVPIHNNVNEFCEISIKENYGGVLGNYLLLTDKLINKMKKAHQHYGVGFVDSKYSLYRELHRGIHWVFTNQAVKLRHYLDHLQNK